MKKFLKIYDDSSSRYVVVNASDVKFVNKYSNTRTDIIFNVKESTLDTIEIAYNSDSGFLVQNAIVDAIKKISVKGYTNSFIEVKLPVAVTSITIN
jgi:hypothetical protein